MSHLLELIKRYPVLEPVQNNIQDVYHLLEDAFLNGKKLLTAGNGGSAADAEHIAGELMKRFQCARVLPAEFTSSLAALKKSSNLNADYFDYIHQNLQSALPVIALTGHYALASACINDIDGSIIFAQQLYGWGNRDDVFLALSTSGNSKNIIYAALTAKVKGMKVAALTGGSGGELLKIANASIVVPEHETYKIQELHIPVYHTICLMLEERFFT